LKFSELGLNADLQAGIDAIGFENTTPVQEQAIPQIMAGKDIIACAQTGTGKTAAFLLPVLHKICESGSDHETIKALVIVPTRELAVQIDQQLEGLSYFTNTSSLAIYGGGDGKGFSREKQALTTGVDIVVGTPGRIIAHLNMGYVKINQLQHLILDEADRMLNMGFYDDIMKIISYLPAKRQNLMFSATMPKKIRELANKVLNEPAEVNIAISKPAENITQAAFILYEKQKIPFTEFLLTARQLKSVIIFCSTKQSAKNLNQALQSSNLVVKEIHSDLTQETRNEVIRDFRNRKVNVLVATDILARGIDVENIDMVVNFDVPQDEEDYVHRIGRTARAASKGIAITLVNEKDQNALAAIEKFLDKPIRKGEVPDKFGPTPEYNPRMRSPKKHFKRKKKSR